jgi:hypothetical protein
MVADAMIESQFADWIPRFEPEDRRARGGTVRCRAVLVEEQTTMRIAPRAGGRWGGRDTIIRESHAAEPGRRDDIAARDTAAFVSRTDEDKGSSPKLRVGRRGRHQGPAQPESKQES